jgi:hypothetical protein
MANDPRRKGMPRRPKRSALVLVCRVGDPRLEGSGLDLAGCSVTKCTGCDHDAWISLSVLDQLGRGGYVPRPLCGDCLERLRRATPPGEGRGRYVEVDVDRDTDPASLPWSGLMRPGQVVNVKVWHESWCRRPQGERCTCGAEKDGFLFPPGD